MCALAAFRKCVVGLEAIAPTAQIRRGSRRELVAGREEQLGSEALEQRAPTLVAWKRGTQRADALGRNDWNQPCLPRQREGALVARRVGFADGREGVVLVAHEQQVAPDPLRVSRDLRDALDDRALEVQLQHHAYRARKPGVQADREVQRQHMA